MLSVSQSKIIRGTSNLGENQAPCLFGVSVGDAAAPLDEAAAGWRWTASRFERAAVLLGDSLQRLTIQITEGVEAGDAAPEAQRRGEAVLARINASFFPVPLVLRTSELADEPAYSESLERFANVFESNSDFRRAIHRDAESFCERQARRGRLLVEPEVAIALSCRYLIEEVAVYETLAMRGWIAETYVGSELSVLASFMTGDLPGVSKALEERTHISLKIRHPKEA